MGRKGMAAKALMRRSDAFADAFNTLFRRGGVLRGRGEPGGEELGDCRAGGLAAAFVATASPPLLLVTF